MIRIYNESEPVIVSVSRRTDIPAYYSNWFVARLEQGFVDYRHPFSQERVRILLNPDQVAGFVFWSKNFQPFLPHLDRIQRSFRSYFHFTITGYGPSMEPQVPSEEDVLATFKSMSRLTSPGQMIWRYDPILLSDRFSHHYHRQKFLRLANELAGYSRTCIISFVHVYAKIRQALLGEGVECSVTESEMLELTDELRELASRHDFQLLGCCHPELQLAGVPTAECISARLFRELFPDFPDTPLTRKKSSTRKGCGCVFCQDIGAYNTCAHGCRYCYANSNSAQALRFYRSHRDEATSLLKEHSSAG